MSGPPHAFPAAGRAWPVLFALCAATILSYLDRQLIYLLIDPIRATLGVSDTQISLIQGLAFVLLYTLVGIPVGRLVDRFNRRNLIIAGVMLWSIMTMLCGLSTNFWQLFAARAGVGIGEAVLMPAAISMIADYFPPLRRGRAIAALSTCIGIGAGLSFLLGSMVLRYFPGDIATPVPLMGPLLGWQIAFIAAGAPGILICLLLLTVREPDRMEKAVRTGESVGIWPILRPYLRVAGPALGCVYAAGSILNIMVYGVGAWSAAYFMRQFGLSGADVGVMIGLSIMMTTVVGALGGGWLSDAFARHRLGGRIDIYPIAIAIAFPFAIAWPLVSTPYLALGLLIAANILCNGAVLTTPTMVQELAPNEMRGLLVAGYTMCMGAIGAGLGPISVALVTDYLFGDERMIGISLLCVSLPCMTIASLLMLLGRRAYARARGEMIALTASHSST